MPLDILGENEFNNYKRIKSIETTLALQAAKMDLEANLFLILIERLPQLLIIIMLCHMVII